MKVILIFIDWFTPGFKAGGPVSSNANMIAHLAGEFNFKVVTRNTDYTENIPYPELTPDNWCNQDGFEGFYISRPNLKFSTLKKLLKDTACDVVYINGIYSWYFSVLPLFLAKKTKKPVIVSARGMLSSHALGVKSFKKNLFIRMARFMGLYKNVVFHATNEEEALAIRKLLGENTEIKVAPNLPKKMPSVLPQKQKQPGTLNLISITRISPEKNTLFSLQVLKELASKLPEDIQLTYDIYGPVYNGDYWAQCKEVKQSLPQNIRVNYQGSIAPHKLPAVISKAHFLFFPTRGENFGHTILESFQCGCPVIISDHTPWRNLEETGVGWDIQLNQPGRFVEVIEYCAAMGQEEYNDMSLRAFDYAKQVTGDPEVVEANRRLFEVPIAIGSRKS